MDPFKQMKDEHRVIERIIDVLEKILNGLEDGQQVPPELIMADVSLLEEFTNGYHLGKEKAILVPYLMELGKPEFVDAIQIYINQLKDCEKYTAAIIDSMPAYDSGDLEAVKTIMENGRMYAEKIKPLFEKEDESVYNPLKQVFTRDQQDQFLNLVKDFDDNWHGPLLMNYQKMVRELERKSCLAVW